MWKGRSVLRALKSILVRVSSGALGGVFQPASGKQKICTVIQMALVSIQSPALPLYPTLSFTGAVLFGGLKSRPKTDCSLWEWLPGGPWLKGPLAGVGLRTLGHYAAMSGVAGALPFSPGPASGGSRAPFVMGVFVEVSRLRLCGPFSPPVGEMADTQAALLAGVRGDARERHVGRGPAWLLHCVSVDDSMLSSVSCTSPFPPLPVIQTSPRGLGNKHPLGRSQREKKCSWESADYPLHPPLALGPLLRKRRFQSSISIMPEIKCQDSRHWKPSLSFCSTAAFHPLKENEKYVKHLRSRRKHWGQFSCLRL